MADLPLVSNDTDKGFYVKGFEKGETSPLEFTEADTPDKAADKYGTKYQLPVGTKVMVFIEWDEYEVGMVEETEEQQH